MNWNGQTQEVHLHESFKNVIKMMIVWHGFLSKVCLPGNGNEHGYLPISWYSNWHKSHATCVLIYHHLCRSQVCPHFSRWFTLLWKKYKHKNPAKTITVATSCGGDSKLRQIEKVKDKPLNSYERPEFVLNMKHL